MGNDVKIDLDAKAKEIAEQLKGLNLSNAKTIIQLAEKWLENMAIINQ